MKNYKQNIVFIVLFAAKLCSAGECEIFSAKELKTRLQFEKDTQIFMARLEKPWRSYKPEKRIKLQLNSTTTSFPETIKEEQTAQKIARAESLKRIAQLQKVIAEETARKQKLEKQTRDLKNEISQLQVSKGLFPQDQSKPATKRKKRGRRKNQASKSIIMSQETIAVTSTLPQQAEEIENREEVKKGIVLKHRALQTLFKEYNVKTKPALIDQLTHTCMQILENCKKDPDYFKNTNNPCYFINTINASFSYEFCTICKHFNIFPTSEGDQSKTHPCNQRNMSELIHQMCQREAAALSFIQEHPKNCSDKNCPFKIMPSTDQASHATGFPEQKRVNVVVINASDIEKLSSSESTQQ